MHWLSPIFYVEVKPGPLEKMIKRLTSIGMKVLRRIDLYILFDHKRNDEILEELKV